MRMRRPAMAVPRREMMGFLVIALLLFFVPLFFVPLHEPSLPEPFVWMEFSRLDAHAVHEDSLEDLATVFDYDNTPVSSWRPRFHYTPEWVVSRSASVVVDSHDADGSRATAEHSPHAPVVSVITTLHNANHLLWETASTVLSQSLAQLEWVVVDDFSDDPASLALLARLRAHPDPRVRVLRNADPSQRGLPGARNLGIRASSAPYVLCVDGDDLLEPTFLEKAAWFLETHPRLSLVNSWSVGFGGMRYLHRKGFEAGDELLTANYLTATTLVRRSALEEAGLFDASLVGGKEDWDLWLRLASLGHWGHTLPEVHFWYRRRPWRPPLTSAERAARDPDYMKAHRAAQKAHISKVSDRQKRQAIAAAAAETDAAVASVAAAALAAPPTPTGSTADVAKARLLPQERFWENNDQVEAIERFAELMRERYPRLYAGGLPALAPQLQLFDDVPTQIPFANLLDKPVRRLLLMLPRLAPDHDLVHFHVVRQLVRKGWELTVVCTELGPHPWERDMTALTPDVFVLPRFLQPGDHARFVAYLTNSRQLDAVLLSASAAAYHMLPLLRVLAPTAAYVDLVHEDRAMARFSVARRRFLHRTVALSLHVRAHLLSVGAERGRVGLMHPCLEPRAFTRVHAARRQLRSQLGLADDQLVVAVLGSRDPSQRSLLALSALARLQEDTGAGGEAEEEVATHSLVSSAVHTLLLGEQPVPSRLLDRALRSLNSSMHSIPEATPANHGLLVQYLSACDLVLYTSSVHGVPLPLLQAMSMSLYPVVTWAPGRDELVRRGDGVGTLIQPAGHTGEVQPHSTAAAGGDGHEEALATAPHLLAEEERLLAEALAEAAANLERTRALGNEARELILRRWSPHAMTEQLLEELEVASEQVLLDSPLSVTEQLAARELATIGLVG
eukprot:CAMPEP_0174245616 /NCGR_PEP_ID=MMETSP0417-20130205/39908_1 /TAXON_ID=242541 /ORGANISM="Mayorella sp, Strain BSH-02190019" /LENGTH=902 /DNA_ID=CAMNT_0015325419 /DNA_START=86 /DNA_END=2790 /DNA_ORIENTATION=-